MQMYGSNVSCGVHQVAGLDHYGENSLHLLLMLLSSQTNPSTGMIVFSDADLYGNGTRLAAEIRKAFGRKGLVQAKNINPNSGNRITTWLWSPSWKVVAEWMAEQPGKLSNGKLYTKERVSKVMYFHRDEAEDEEERQAAADWDNDDDDNGACDCEECVEERMNNARI